MSKRKPRRNETLYAVEMDGTACHAICTALDLLHFSIEVSDEDLCMASGLASRIEPLIPAPGFPELTFRKPELELIVRSLDLAVRHIDGETVVHPLSGFRDTVLPGEMVEFSQHFRSIHSALSVLL